MVMKSQLCAEFVDTQAVPLAITEGNDRIRHHPADRLRFWPSEDGFSHRIPVSDDAARVHRDDGIEGAIENAAEPPHVLVLRQPGGFSFGRGAQLAVDGRTQTLEIAFEDVVVRTTAHDVYGGVFTDVSRDNDEWNVQVGRFEYGQRARRIELRLRVVGDNQVPAGAKLGPEPRLASCRCGCNRGPGAMCGSDQAGALVGSRAHRAQR